MATNLVLGKFDANSMMAGADHMTGLGDEEGHWRRRDAKEAAGFLIVAGYLFEGKVSAVIAAIKYTVAVICPLSSVGETFASTILELYVHFAFCIDYTVKILIRHGACTYWVQVD